MSSSVRAANAALTEMPSFYPEPDFSSCRQPRAHGDAGYSAGVGCTESSRQPRAHGIDWKSRIGLENLFPPIPRLRVCLSRSVSLSTTMTAIHARMEMNPLPQIGMLEVSRHPRSRSCPWFVRVRFVTKAALHALKELTVPWPPFSAWTYRHPRAHGADRFSAPQGTVL